MKDNRIKFVIESDFNIILNYLNTKGFNNITYYNVARESYILIGYKKHRKYVIKFILRHRCYPSRYNKEDFIPTYYDNISIGGYKIHIYIQPFAINVGECSDEILQKFISLYGLRCDIHKENIGLYNDNWVLFDW